MLYTECAKIKKNNSGAKRLRKQSLFIARIMFNKYERSMQVQCSLRNVAADGTYSYHSAYNAYK